MPAGSLVGAWVANRYRVDAEVGSGGFGTVYVAWHATLGTRVALKILATPQHLDPETRAERHAMFMEEARVLAKLRHPHIVAALDAGILESPRLTEPAPYIVMGWCGHGSLSDVIDARGRMALGEVLALMRPIVAAIGYAHAEGVVHRDLKPSNIMFDEVLGQRVPRVIDFGIAKLVMPEERAGSGATMTGAALTSYTPAYAAPEQVAGVRTGPWTDVHALGLILVHLLTGQRPYGGDNAQLGAIDPDRPTPGRMGVDVGALERVLERALALRPSDRFHDATELLAAIDAATGASTGASFPVVVAQTASRAHASPAGRRGLVLGLAAVGVVAAGGGGLLFVSHAASRRAERDEESEGATEDEAPTSSSTKPKVKSKSKSSAQPNAAQPTVAASPSRPKRHLRDLAMADLVAMAGVAGLQVTERSDPDLRVTVTKDLMKYGQASLQLFPAFPGATKGTILKELGGYLLETRKAWWTHQAYVIDGESALVFLARNDETLTAFNALSGDLAYDVRGDTLGGGDPAGEAAGVQIAPWSAKTLGEIGAGELESRLRAAGASKLNGPFGDAGPLPLQIPITFGNDRGEVSLYRTGGASELAARKAARKRFAYARDGEALLVLEGTGSLSSPDVLAQVLKGLQVTAAGEPPI